MSEQQPPPGWQQQPPGPPGWGQQPPPGWGPPGWGPPPQPPMTAGRMFSIMLGGLFGGVVGFFVPFLPGFLYAVFTGLNLNMPGLLIGLLMLITVPCGVVLGVLWARQKTRR